MILLVFVTVRGGGAFHWQEPALTHQVGIFPVIPARLLSGVYIPSGSGRGPAWYNPFLRGTCLGNE